MSAPDPTGGDDALRGSPPGPKLLLLPVGVVLILSPMVFLLLGTVGGFGSAFRPALTELLVAWALLWLVGFTMMVTGIVTAGKRAASARVDQVRPPGLRIALVAGVVLLLGFVILAGTIAFVQSCERPCIGGGGVVGNFSTASAACGAVCAIPVGQGLLWPIQLLGAAFTLSIADGVLSLVAVARAIPG